MRSSFSQCIVQHAGGQGTDLTVWSSLLTILSEPRAGFPVPASETLAGDLNTETTEVLGDSWSPEGGLFPGVGLTLDVGEHFAV